MPACEHCKICWWMVPKMLTVDLKGIWPVSSLIWPMQIQIFNKTWCYHYNPQRNVILLNGQQKHLQRRKTLARQEKERKVLLELFCLLEMFDSQWVYSRKRNCELKTLCWSYYAFMILHRVETQWKMVGKQWDFTPQQCPCTSIPFCT